MRLPFLCVSLILPAVLTACPLVREPGASIAAAGSPPPGAASMAVVLDVGAGVPVNSLPLAVSGKAKLSVAKGPGTTQGLYNPFVGVVGAGESPTPPPPDHRLCFTGTAMYSSGFASVRREVRSEFDARMTIALTSLKGIMDSASAGRLQADFTKETFGQESTAYHALVARWNEGAQGFSIETRTATGVGPVVTFNNTLEVELRLLQTGGSILYYCRPRPTSLLLETGWTLLSSATQVAPDALAPAFLGFGADFIHKGGKVYFDFARFDELVTPASPLVESTIFELLEEALTELDSAAAGLPLGLANAESRCQSARSLCEEASGMLDSAADAGQLLPNTQFSLTGKNLTRVISACNKSLALLDKPAPNAKAIASQIGTARSFLVVASSNLMGYKATSWKKVPLAFVPDTTK